MREVEVYGRRFFMDRVAGGWEAFPPTDDGKRAQVGAVRLPPFVVTEDDVLQYLADLFHESARPDRDVVRWIR